LNKEYLKSHHEFPNKFQGDILQSNGDGDEETKDGDYGVEECEDEEAENEEFKDGKAENEGAQGKDAQEALIGAATRHGDIVVDTHLLKTKIRKASVDEMAYGRTRDENPLGSGLITENCGVSLRLDASEGNVIEYGEKLIAHEGNLRAYKGKFAVYKRKLAAYEKNITACEFELLEHGKELQINQDIFSMFALAIAEVQCLIQNLLVRQKGYLDSRHRFLDEFRRDILHDPEIEWEPVFDSHNPPAHHGDAVTDVGLYDGWGDNDTIINVYRLEPNNILTLARNKDFCSIGILDARASLKSNKDVPIPQEIEDSWVNYVESLQQNWEQQPKDNKVLGQAYSEFWKAYNRNMGA
jgi:hypothetical protein